MNKYKKLLILLLVILGIAAIFVYFARKPQKTTSPGQKNVQELKTTLAINGNSGTESFDVSGFIGKTALAATEANAKVVATGTGVNAFVTSINGRTADSKKHEFWELDANGVETQVGAGSYIIQKGDSILWKLNTY